uniref:F-box domain-containing protein n=1 Tax=Stomoxys calcitrans TaxID=35570 RepID=A0A1I8QEA8_STOCA
MEGVLNNVDVLIQIYRKLDLDDQIRLSQASANLKNVFESFIFSREDYSTLAVSASQGYFAVTNGCSHRRLLLQHHELMEFIRCHQLMVETFLQRNGTILDVRPFRNLTSLSYSNCIISRKHLKLFASLPLEKLDIVSCTNEFGRDIMLGSTWNVEYLIPMRKLRLLKVHSVSDYRRKLISFREFDRMITRTTLEGVWLRCSILSERPFGNGMNAKSPDTTVALKHLDIGFRIRQNNSLLPYMRHFVNLVTLTISVEDQPITEKILLEIVRMCVNLKVLHFKSSSFDNIQDFVVPSKLTEFSVTSCYAFNADNLRQILNLAQLKKFHMTETLTGDVEDNFAISSSIEHLYVDGDFWDSNIELAFGGGENLKHLSWLVSGFVDNATANGAALKRCTNLEELNLKLSNLPTKPLLELNSLHKLTITLGTASVPWLHIEEILKHPNLTELTLDGHFDYDDPPMDMHAPTAGFIIGVGLLKISFQIFKVALDFWLDLLSQNIQLQLIVSDVEPDEEIVEFVRILISHEKFPSDLRTLVMFDSHIKCRDLRHHLESTMQRLRRDVDHIEYYPNQESIFVIKFDRNLEQVK